MTSLAKSAALQEHFQKFINGSHILHFHQVVDAYGHLSFRHPFQADTFVMSLNIAPAQVSSPEDLIAYNIEDAEPVNPNCSQGFAERRIHSEIYKRHPGVNAVVHSHSEAVVPYTISGKFDNDNKVTLMRGHGFTVVADSIELAVMRAVYTQKNASIQTTALMIQGVTRTTGSVRGLSKEECAGSDQTTRWSMLRPWHLWVKEVEENTLYVNSA
ncbi:decarboxylase tropJ [Colletotrichum spaethianum]|uniref:Decarboxylase tropJ n=1 Tax=Colletotrichum spaethianum TaxID=700344 RepID=A0AA37PD82_9PEZI|nr:decarboxylase tropJ [Colletotrichum spaethianum]GKT50049.1 decarboxylase tropJ [Colletotrichum spaethianum]